MVRQYKRKTNRLTEAERGIHLAVSKRREPDVELLARIIVDMAMTDPLGLHPSEHDTTIPTLEATTARK
jgi:hypothetical protein